MGWSHSGEYGMLAGFTWGVLCNVQVYMPWYRRPWLHAVGMTAGYFAFSAASAWEDIQLQRIITSYERKGYVIPEDRKKLFDPKEYA